jgi:hypothetical protein
MRIRKWFYLAASVVFFPCRVLPYAIVYDSSYSTLSGGCAAAGSTATFAITLAWAGVTSLTCSANVQFFAGGVIRPASGSTVTFTGALTGDLTQHFDNSLGGTVSISQALTPQIYPEWWGAAGGTDSTAAFQAALNTISTTTNSMKLSIPINNSCYRISSMLIYSGANPGSLTIEGTVAGNGGVGSCLTWTGSSGGTILKIMNAGFPTVRNIALNGNFLAKTDLWIDTDHDTVPTGYTTYGGLIENSSFGGFTGSGSSGIQFSHACASSPQVSEMIVRHGVFATAANTNGSSGILVLCGGNTKNFSIYDSTFYNMDVPINVTSDGFSWTNITGNEFLNAAVTDIVIGTGAATITGNGSEGGARFLKLGGSTVATTATLSGNYWAGVAPSDDCVIQNFGSLILNGNVLSNGRTNSSIPKVCTPGSLFSSGTGHASVTSHANTFINAAESPNTSSPFWGNGGEDFPDMTLNWAGGNQFSWTSTGDVGGTTYAPVTLPQYSPSSVMGPQVFPIQSTNPAPGPGLMALAYQNGVSGGIPQGTPQLLVSTGVNKWARVNLSDGYGGYAVAALPACNANSKGQTEWVNDQLGTPSYGGFLTGGGDLAWPVFCNGSSWTAH